MIIPKDVITYTFSKVDTPFILENAKKACIGGPSSVRPDEKERKRDLLTDQLAGQTANYVGSLHFFGSPEPYHQVRAYANAHPKEGDHGRDFLGYDVDMKGSFMRAWRDPIRYRLPVRPREWYKNWIYVHCMIEPFRHDDQIVTVHMVGWARTDMLPKEVDKSGVFEGAYTLFGKYLNPIHSLIINEHRTKGSI